jgi:glutamate/tyrosine decarboxylase-like PLP-dependent enzyme
VTHDPHKQLYVPMGMGMLFFKDPYLAQEMEITAEYTIRKNSFDLGQRSFEGSRPAHALYLKMNLDMLGKSGYAQLVDDSVDLARKFAQMIYLSDDFQLLILPELNIILYRYLPKVYRNLRPKDFTAEINAQIDQVNLDLQKRQFLSGRTFVSRTRLSIKRYGENPITCLRAVLANPMTDASHLEEILNHQREIANTGHSE